MDGHRRLGIWRLAGDLIVRIYAVCKALPREELFVVIPQLKCAAWSVQNNIAEGNARRSQPEKRRFYDYSLASLAEVDSMVQTAARLYTIDPEDLQCLEAQRKQITRGLTTLRRLP